ncbi:MAG: SH3 domain-containing protein, partial [Eubacterium sp.]|nr:SH3 domain-containing protein [Eubacterium sp.]
LTILLVLPSFHFTLEAATDYSSELRKKGFPETYISSLNKLKQAHPNWNFEVLNVGEDFAVSVSKERPSHSQQLIQMYSGNNGKGYYCTCSKCLNSKGSPKVVEGTNWVAASQKAVEYYLDPRNFLDEQHIFQFESTFSNSGQTQAGVESILKGTWMYNSNIVYKNEKGVSITYKSTKNNQPVKYSQAIMDASNFSGLSAYYLASKIVQEVGGTKATAGGASGTYKDYAGIYNYYNIGAYTGATDGLKWASYKPNNSAHVQTSSGSTVNLRSKPTTSSPIVASVPSGTAVKTYEYTAKQSDGYKWVKLTNVSIGGKTYTGYIRSDYFIEKTEKDTYNRPWTDPYISIYNGAKWIANNFGSQYNGYLQKFNVNPASKYMHSNEYMANVQAAASEAVKTYTAYKNVGALNSAITFSIPVFKNMPGDILATPKMNAVKVNSNGSFTLSWNAVSQATKYELYIKNADGSYSLMKTTTATSFTTAIAAVGKQYSFRMRAVNSTHNTYSDFSNTVSAVNNGNITSLTAPTFNAVMINPDLSFTLSWSSVTGADKYEIYIKNADGSYSRMKTTTETSFTTSTAIYRKQYTFKVRAYTSKNKIYSNFSNEVSEMSTKLPAPKFNEPKVNENGSFELSWSAVNGADQYEIYIKNSNGYSRMKTTPEASFTTAVAAYGKQYAFMVRAVDSNNNTYSEYSNEVFTVNHTKLSEPAFNPVTINANASFKLSWSSVSGADKYEIYIKNTDDSYSCMKTTTATSFTTAVATYRRDYAFKVRAVDSKNNTYSDFSNIVSAINDTKMTTPKLNDITVNENGKLSLSWNTVVGADKYEIYVYNNSTKKYQLNGTVTKTSATTAYAPYGVQYSYKVRAVDSKNNVYSAYSNVVSATNNVKLLTPTFNPVTINANGSFKLSWSAVKGANKYEIYIKNTDGSYSCMKTTSATSFTTSVAMYTRPYSFKVKAIDSKTNAASDFSNIVSATNKDKIPTPTFKAVLNANASFTLSWNTVYGVDKYEIYIKNSNGTFSLMKTTTDTSFTTAVAAYGKPYTFKVRAVDSKKKLYSEFSSTASITNNKYMATPKMNIVVNANGSFTLSWNSVAGADKYELYMKQADGSYKLMKTTTSNSFTTVVAAYGKEYSYNAKAVDSKNKVYSAYSNVVSATNNKKSFS